MNAAKEISQFELWDSLCWRLITQTTNSHAAYPLYPGWSKEMNLIRERWRTFASLISLPSVEFGVMALILSSWNWDSYPNLLMLLELQPYLPAAHWGRISSSCRISNSCRISISGRVSISGCISTSGSTSGRVSWLIVKTCLILMPWLMAHRQDVSHPQAVSHHQATQLVMRNRILLKEWDVYWKSSTSCILKRSLQLLVSRSVNLLFISSPPLPVVYLNRIQVGQSVFFVAGIGGFGQDYFNAKDQLSAKSRAN